MSYNNGNRSTTPQRNSSLLIGILIGIVLGLAIAGGGGMVSPEITRSIHESGKASREINPGKISYGKIGRPGPRFGRG